MALFVVVVYIAAEIVDLVEDVCVSTPLQKSQAVN